MKSNQLYTVKKANRLDVHHYHGSWFEYTWEMELMDEAGETLKGKFDTWSSYESLENLQIIFSENDIFEVVPGVEEKPQTKGEPTERTSPVGMSIEAKKNVLLFGMALHLDVEEGGLNCSEEDGELLQGALFKAYGVTDETTTEERAVLDAEMSEHKREIIEACRRKVQPLLGEKEA